MKEMPGFIDVARAKISRVFPYSLTSRMPPWALSAHAFTDDRGRTINFQWDGISWNRLDAPPPPPAQQGRSGLGLEAQQAALSRFAEAEGYNRHFGV
jgi:hypothetical protein